MAKMFIFSIVLFFSLIQFVYAHGGGLDKYGCHKSSKTGYHCHNSSGSSGGSSGGSSSTIHIPPFAYFSANETAALKVSLDASLSFDSDGTITSYAWSVSNGQTAFGKTTTLTLEESGTYTIILTVTDDDGSTDTFERSITVLGPRPPKAYFIVTPSFGTAPIEISLNASTSFDLDGVIKSYTWLASDGQTASGKTAVLNFDKSGTYTISLTVTDNDGEIDKAEKLVTVKAPENQSTTNQSATQNPQPTTIRLINISTRAPIEGGAGDVIAGFIIEGTGTQKVLINAFPIEAGVDPKLTLHKLPSGEVIASNDNWADHNSPCQPISSSEHAFSNPMQAGCLLDLSAGAYTAIMSSVGTMGIGLVGVNALSTTGTTQLVNISTRAPIRGGVGDVIAGFILTGTGTQKVMIRALGIDTGIDPKITLHHLSTGEIIASNDNWTTDNSPCQSIPSEYGLPNPKEAACLLELSAGAYTAIMSSVEQMGLGLISVDLVP
jgi:chitodextrinase